MCRVVVPHMKAQKAGKIINMSSISRKTVDPYCMPYSTMKGAIITFT
ncbi:MAG: hypothetical protein CL874_02550 [Dehalococcoidales bacterium]|nr:hypothetical protein [Dehalococcoidales bacterium]